jgi:hypothetical protein
VSLSAAAASGKTLETLQALRDDLAARMEVCTSDQNFAVLGRLLTDTLARISDLGGDEQPAPPKTGLSRFEEKLRERSSASSGSRSA